MVKLQVSEAELVSVRGGQALYLPRDEGGLWVLVFYRGAYRLRVLEEPGILGTGNAPGEGAGDETPPV